GTLRRFLYDPTRIHVELGHPDRDARRHRLDLGEATFDLRYPAVAPVAVEERLIALGIEPTPISVKAHDVRLAEGSSHEHWEVLGVAPADGVPGSRADEPDRGIDGEHLRDGCVPHRHVLGRGDVRIRSLRAASCGLV